MPKPQVVLDTNVFISGLILDRGHAYQILQAWQDNRFELITSQELFDEYLDVIQRPKLTTYLSHKPRLIRQLTLQLSRQITKVIRSVPPIKLRDPKDYFILDLCQSAHVDYLVTGDKDLLSLPEMLPFKIITPAKFCQLLNL